MNLNSPAVKGLRPPTRQLARTRAKRQDASKLRTLAEGIVMIAVIFEVVLNSARASRYFDLAAALRPDLEKADGFLSIERFQSLNQDNKYVSLSFWRDRAAVEAWYRHTGHREAQLEGRESIFENYRIRVAEVFRDYDLADGRPQV